MSRKVSRKGLTKKADRLFSLKVRARGYCELAGKDEVACKGALQCAHILSRKYRAIRWDEENALSLCMGHHTFYTMRPFEWMRLMDALYPGRMDALWTLCQEPWDKDLVRVLEALDA